MIDEDDLFEVDDISGDELAIDEQSIINRVEIQRKMRQSVKELSENKVEKDEPSVIKIKNK